MSRHMPYEQRKKDFPRLTHELEKHLLALRDQEESPLAAADLPGLLWGVARREIGSIQMMRETLLVLLSHHQLDEDLLLETLSHPESLGRSKISRTVLQQESLTPFLRNYLLLQLTHHQHSVLRELRETGEYTAKEAGLAYALAVLWGPKRRWESAQVLTRIWDLPPAEREVACTLLQDTLEHEPASEDGEGPLRVKELLSVAQQL